MDGDSAVAVDLFALPLGRVVPSVTGCTTLSPCAFRIPAGSAFQDGSPLTPAAVAKAIRRAWHQWGVASGCDAVVEGDRVVVTANRQGMGLLPFAPLDKPGPGGRWVGTGPYRVVRQTPSRVTLAAVRKGRQPDRIELTAVHGRRGVLARLLSGTVDVATSVPADHVRLLRSAARIGGTYPFRNLLMVLEFNERDPWLASAAVRRCVAAALSRGFRLLRTRAQLDDLPAPFRSGRTGDDCPATAASLPKGPVTMEVLQYGFTRLPAEAVIATLGDLGLDVEPIAVPGRSRPPPLESPLRLSMINLNYPAGPIRYLHTGAVLNAGYHSDPKLDALLDAGAGWSDIQAEFVRSPPFVPLGILPRYVVTSSRFRVLTPAEMGPGPFSLGLAIRPANEGP